MKAKQNKTVRPVRSGPASFRTVLDDVPRALSGSTGNHACGGGEREHGVNKRGRLG
jgi:hypothetical protein